MLWSQTGLHFPLLPLTSSLDLMFKLGTDPLNLLNPSPWFTGIRILRYRGKLDRVDGNVGPLDGCWYVRTHGGCRRRTRSGAPEETCGTEVGVRREGVGDGPPVGEYGIPSHTTRRETSRLSRREGILPTRGEG